LNDNNIGNAGCEAIASLLEDQNCNIHTIQIYSNNIGNEGAISLVNGLSNNNVLKELDLNDNPIDRSSAERPFFNLLCNASSINDTYLSNHTLEKVEVDRLNVWSFLQMNKCSNKSHVAIRKILLYHSDIDMEPFFGWDMDGEWTLKALPYVVAWFDKAWIAKACDLEEGRVAVFAQELERDRISRRALASIYKFAKAMPLRFVPADHVKADKKKQKRVN